MGAFGKCGALLAGRHFARSARHHAAAAAAASAPQHAAAPMFLEEDEVRAAAPTLDCRVGSHTEWDPLEEVIVGRIDGARIPEATSALEAVVPERYIEWFRENGGQPYAAEAVQAAAQELDHLSEVLRQEGVEVRRPEVMDFSVPYKTPDFECTGGMYAAMPRDVLLVVGNEIIEAPMAWRSRYFEFRSYRRLIKEYFKTGARWTAAPKPQMADSLYRGIDEWVGSGGEDAFVSIVTEDEPVFDAAEFTRFGRDLFVQRSHVTNEFGIEWMRRHLGDEYNITVLDFDDRNGMHIDGTFVPIGEGKLLINPARPCLTGSEKSWYGLPSPGSNTERRIHTSGTRTTAKTRSSRFRRASRAGTCSLPQSLPSLPHTRCTSRAHGQPQRMCLSLTASGSSLRHTKRKRSSVLRIGALRRFLCRSAHSCSLAALSIARPATSGAGGSCVPSSDRTCKTLSPLVRLTHHTSYIEFHFTHHVRVGGLL
eukprot:Rhum_TRINITY_DN4396_c0_g2::Rhum_TRINITY_DN4396_c0_g2_i1::g.14166::m.14166/K00613/GATM; glycine amidinotransferase